MWRASTRIALSSKQTIVEVSGLGKDFGTFTAVDAIDFKVDEREIFGFLGPNGAGKTTTINMLATLLKPTARPGRAGRLRRRRPAERACGSRIGMVFQDPSLDDRLTAEENLQFHAMLYNVPAPRPPRAASTRCCDIVGLTDRRHSLVRTFSGGMKRRLEIARGLLHHPKVLFLDEPTVGLDPQTRNAIWDHVRRLRDEVGITVFMTTHYMDEAENCDRIAIIDHGKIQALDTPAALKRLIGGDKIIVTGDAGLAAGHGGPLRRRGAARSDGEYHFQVEHGARVRAARGGRFQRPHQVDPGQAAEPRRRVPAADRAGHPRGGRHGPRPDAADRQAVAREALTDASAARDLHDLAARVEGCSCASGAGSSA